MDPMLLLLLGGGAFAIIGGIAYGGYTLLNPSRSASDRLAEMTGGGAKKEERDVVGERIAERLAGLAASDDEEDQTILKRRLVQAGFKSRHAPQMFSASRVTLAVLLPILVAPVAAFQSLTTMAMMVIVAAAGGYYGPILYVNGLIEKRQDQILKPMPDALDLLVTSVEAGLGLDAAFRRVAKEMETAAPELSQEFQIVNYEIGAGLTRIEALRHLEERTGIDEVKGLVNMLVQAERFGTSIARSLRVHSEISRQKRMSRAEQKAAQVSPKLTVVMILFLMPSLIGILLGPAVIRIAQSPLFTN